MKQKIKKLLALANDAGATEAEAENAMAKAMKLMIEHNVKEEDLTEDIEIKIDEEVILKTKYKFHMFAISAATKITQCYSYRRGDEYLIAGRADNREACAILTAYLIDQINQQYKIHLTPGMSQKARAQFRRTFKDACGLRIYNRSVEIMKTIPTGKELVVLESRSDEARNWLQDKYNLRSGRRSRMSRGSGTTAGFMAGDRINIRKPIS